MTAIRSLLFVPADSERKIAKALESDADALILDLEDSVAPANKPSARETVRGIARGRKQLFVRINPLDGGDVESDLNAALHVAPIGIVLPKSQSGRDVAKLDALLTAAEAQAGLTGGSVAILPIVTETAAGTLDVASYTGASPRLWGATWGAEDLGTDLGAPAKRYADGTYRDPFRLARAQCLLGAIAADVRPVDTIYADFRDEEGLRAECQDAAKDGFTAKMAIHPSQVGIINEAFTPSADELAAARAVIAAFSAAGDPGVVSLEGRMLDRPHLVQAQRLVARAVSPAAAS